MATGSGAFWRAGTVDPHPVVIRIAFSVI